MPTDLLTIIQQGSFFTDRLNGPIKSASQWTMSEKSGAFFNLEFDFWQSLK